MNRNGYIALIGLPGCGKSTLGRLLAGALGLPVVDLDERIVKMAGASSPELFAVSEAHFRDWETKALASAQGESVVLSCGGGVIKRPENREMLGRCGFTVYVDRPVDQIVGDVDVSGRPLLASGGASIAQLKAEREALYQAAADATIVNDGTPETALARLLEALGAAGINHAGGTCHALEGI